ncbi:hypothetical protein V9T40_008267 [Parthenolecanium corni]|uniref:Uncharacterized protein n=1 Tax=Parthenolecanium corni TaxID=536013 RepID=A0AAN9TQ32_9HEMI
MPGSSFGAMKKKKKKKKIMITDRPKNDFGAKNASVEPNEAGLAYDFVATSAGKARKKNIKEADTSKNRGDTAVAIESQTAERNGSSQSSAFQSRQQQQRVRKHSVS